MSNLPCHVVVDLIDAYLAGEVSDETRRALDEHFASCGECSAILAVHEKARTRLSVLRTATPPQSPVRAAARVIGRARRRFYAGVALILALATILIAAGFGQVDSWRMDPPIAVKSAEDFAARTVPGWVVARELGAVTDLAEKLTPWLTVDSVFVDEQQTYILYTTTNRRRVDFDVTATPSWGDAPTQVTTDSQSSWGGVSEGGYHNLAVISSRYLGVRSQVPDGGTKPLPAGASEEVALRLHRGWRVTSVFQRWLAVPTSVDRAKQVSFTLNPVLRSPARFVYEMTVPVLVAGMDLSISNLSLTPEETTLELYNPAAGTAASLMTYRIRFDTAGSEQEYQFTQRVVVPGGAGEKVILTGPPLTKIPRLMRVFAYAPLSQSVLTSWDIPLPIPRKVGE